MKRYHVPANTVIRRRAPGTEWGSPFVTSKAVTYTDEDVVAVSGNATTVYSDNDWFVFRLPRKGAPWTEIRVLQQYVRVSDV